MLGILGHAGLGRSRSRVGLLRYGSLGRLNALPERPAHVPGTARRPCRSRRCAARGALVHIPGMDSISSTSMELPGMLR